MWIACDDTPTRCIQYPYASTSHGASLRWHVARIVRFPEWRVAVTQDNQLEGVWVERSLTASQLLLRRCHPEEMGVSVRNNCSRCQQMKNGFRNDNVIP